jgi:flagellin
LKLISKSLLPFVSFTLDYEETAMTWSINTNTSSLYAQAGLQSAQAGLSKTIQSLSTGLRVNSAADDPAGYAIAIKMTGIVNGSNQAVRNTNDAISLTQVGQSALGDITNALQTMRTLAVQASTGTYSATDQANLQSEFSALATAISNIASATSFNGNKVFGGSSIGIQVGADTAATSTLAISTGALATIAAVATSVDTAAHATAALAAIDTQLATLSSQAAALGSYQIQLSTVVSNLQANVTNTSAARGQIQDVDYASTTAQLSRQQILQNASTAMLAQANQGNSGVMQLLR